MNSTAVLREWVRRFLVLARRPFLRHHRVMKRYLYTFISLIACALFPMKVHAETVESFVVNASLNADRELRIEESITYDFEDEQKHGIYRLIPERYARDGMNVDLRLDIGQSMQDGKAATQEISREGEFKKIRLGQEDLFLSGKHIYKIVYQTNRAINDFPDEQERELYWNVTGNGWSVPIEQVLFTTELPAKPTKVICYTGVFGSIKQDCTIKVDDKKVAIKSDGPLKEGEGLTIAIRLPESSIRDITYIERLTNIVLDNSWILLPFAVFFIMLGIWWNVGRDPKGRGTIIAEYEEPNGLEPALQISLIEQHVPSAAITATLLDLARRGYAKVRFEGDPTKNGWFKPKAKIFYEKLKEPVGLADFEQTLFDAMFQEGDSIDLQTRHESFWKALQISRKQIFQRLKKDGLFGMDPNVMRAMYFLIGIIVIIVLYPILSNDGPASVIAVIVSGVMIMAFGWHMPRTTKAGAIMAERVLGFKKFLSVTEKARLEFTDAPEKQPEQFARFLPAAVAFGVEKQWAEQFAAIQLPQPDYMTSSSANWTAMNYVYATQSFHSASAASMYAAPSSAGSGGSGFSGGGSGGGFGGGGGGSW